MYELNFTATLVAIGETKSGIGKASGKEWKRADFVCEQRGDRYNEKITVSASNAMVDELTALPLGSEVSVKAYVYAREWNGKLYNSIEALKIVPAKAQPTTSAENDGDLPF